MNSNYKHLLAGLSSKEKRALLKQLLRKDTRDKLKQLSEVEAVNAADLQAEAILDPEISPKAVPPAKSATDEPARIFLTGATGFLGAFLLAELLQSTRADIYCLVRARDAGEGQERLKRALEFYSLWDEELVPRIIPVEGDLSEPLLGLSEEQFQALAAKIDTIYHSGASVSWIHPYSALKQANVLGTQEVLKLATQVTAKPVHFVSTVAVFPVVGNSDTRVFSEEDPLDHDGVLYGGYSLSKWVAEKLVTTAGSRGLPVSIHRPALVTGSSQTGAWNTDDGTCTIIKSWIESGAAADVDATMNMVPVDYISKAIVYLSRQNESLGKCFHFANPRSVASSDLTDWINSFGFPVQRIPYDQWRADLLNPANLGEKDLDSIVPLLSLGEAEDAPTMFGTTPEFDCQNTLEGLTGTSIACPPIDDQVFERYLSFFVRHGFLKQPAVA